MGGGGGGEGEGEGERERGMLRTLQSLVEGSGELYRVTIKILQLQPSPPRR